MPTVGKTLADVIRAGNGYYSDDPRVTSIIEYDNAWGGIGYGLNYSGQPDRYTSSDFVRNPRVYWEASDVT